jgi:hypothetical protein
MCNHRQRGRPPGRRKKRKRKAAAVGTMSADKLEAALQITVPPPPAPASSTDGLSFKAVILQWVNNKLHRPPKESKRSASQRLKLWMDGTVHGAALVTSLVAGSFCMYAMVAPGTSLQIRLMAGGLLVYIVKKFVNHLTL